LIEKVRLDNAKLPTHLQTSAALTGASDSNGKMVELINYMIHYIRLEFTEATLKQLIDDGADLTAIEVEKILTVSTYKTISPHVIAIFECSNLANLDCRDIDATTEALNKLGVTNIDAVPFYAVPEGPERNAIRSKQLAKIRGKKDKKKSQKNNRLLQMFSQVTSPSPVSPSVVTPVPTPSPSAAVSSSTSPITPVPTPSPSAAASSSTSPSSQAAEEDDEAEAEEEVKEEVETEPVQVSTSSKTRTELIAENDKLKAQVQKLKDFMIDAGISPLQIQTFMHLHWEIFAEDCEE